MSDTSEKPVQNKVVKTYVDATKVPVPNTYIANIMTLDGGMVLDIAASAILTPRTERNSNNGGYRVIVDKCTNGGLASMDVCANVPPKSVVYIVVTTLNEETIRIHGATNVM